MTETAKDLRRFGYAPGNYYGTCSRCSKQYVADKRAWNCLPCATEGYQNNQIEAEACAARLEERLSEITPHTAWSNYLINKSDAKREVATVDTVTMSGLVHAALVDAVYPWQLLLLIAGGEDVPGYATALTLEEAKRCLADHGAHARYDERARIMNKLRTRRAEFESKLGTKSSITIQASIMNNINSLQFAIDLLEDVETVL